MFPFSFRDVDSIYVVSVEAAACVVIHWDKFIMLVYPYSYKQRSSAILHYLFVCREYARSVMALHCICVAAVRTENVLASLHKTNPTTNNPWGFVGIKDQP